MLQSDFIFDIGQLDWSDDMPSSTPYKPKHDKSISEIRKHSPILSSSSFKRAASIFETLEINEKRRKTDNNSPSNKEARNEDMFCYEKRSVFDELNKKQLSAQSSRKASENQHKEKTDSNEKNEKSASAEPNADIASDEDDQKVMTNEGENGKDVVFENNFFKQMEDGRVSCNNISCLMSNIMCVIENKFFLKI